MSTLIGPTNLSGGQIDNIRSADKSSGSSDETSVEMKKIAAEARRDALEAATVAAQLARTETLAKMMKKGATMMKDLV